MWLAHSKMQEACCWVSSSFGTSQVCYIYIYGIWILSPVSSVNWWGLGVQLRHFFPSKKKLWNNFWCYADLAWGWPPHFTDDFGLSFSPLYIDIYWAVFLILQSSYWHTHTHVPVAFYRGNQKSKWMADECNDGSKKWQVKSNLENI